MWCSAIQVARVRLENELSTGPVWCPVGNTEFRQKEFLLNKKFTAVLTELRIYSHLLLNLFLCPLIFSQENEFKVFPQHVYY